MHDFFKWVCTPHSYFSDIQHLKILPRWCWKATSAVLFVASECPASLSEHVCSLCAHLTQCVCPVRPLHIPGNTNINCFGVFFPGAPLRMVIVACWTWQVFSISNMLGCFHCTWLRPQVCKRTRPNSEEMVPVVENGLSLSKQFTNSVCSFQLWHKVLSPAFFYDPRCPNMKF